jgi:hypothetical protein
MHNTLYAVPAAGSAPVSVVSTMMSRRVIIQEDDSVPNQGLIVFFPQDNFTQGYQYAAGHEPIILGDIVANMKGKGSVLGNPIQKDVSQTVTLRAADIYAKVTSATATVTKIRVQEYA